MTKQPYSIGLDIGTNSVGWAVIDDNCKLMRYKHQNMAGSHLFSEAEKAEKRRGFRSTRRRMARRKQRIAQLQMLMEPMISQVDPAFFARLKESMLHLEDKKVGTSGNILFNDPDFTDATYRKQYPTIYHLRKDLVDSTEKRDIRLVYLALHHIIKYRGHFLYEGQSFVPGASDDSAVKEYITQLDELLGGHDFENHTDECIELLKRTDMNPSSKEKQLSRLFADHDRAMTITALMKLTVGLKADVAKLADVEFELKSFSFGDTDYEDEKRDKLQAALGDDFALVETAEAIYKWSLLHSVLKSCRYLSEAMVRSYDEYKQDLRALKTLYREHAPNQFTGFFRAKKNGKKDDKLVCYENYEERGSIKIDDLVTQIRKQFAGNKAAEISPEYQRFDERAKLGVFLQKQRIRANGAIPNQIHCNELRAILENQSQYYPELAAVKEKISQIASFRIPYHVGPFKSGGEFAWAEKYKNKPDQKIYPWNFNKVIDVDASAEKFIERMRNFCTYLPGREVLPKNSLLYAEYELRNELKFVRVNDSLLGIDVQNRLVAELFTKKKSVSHTALKKWLLSEGVYAKVDSVSGTQQETKFASSLVAYIDFSNMGLSPESHRQTIEQIIKWVTLFEDKKVLKNRLKSLGDALTDEQIKACLKLRYSGWGRLSRELLDGLCEDCGILGSCTVMDVMRQDGRANFMHVIESDQYPFKERIANIQKEAWSDKTEITYDDIKELVGSPGIKRGIWRSIRIVNEIVDIMGYAPQTINIEMARSEDEKKRTSTRRTKLLKQYDVFIKLADEYNKERAKQIKKELMDSDNKALSSRRLYLYFLQNGKCAYTGHDLDISRLSDYDIDHVIPRALLKDDSVNNTVLVTQMYNREKSNEYPLKPEIIQNMRSMWEMWRKAGLMDDTKFRRLVRNRELRDEEVQGFINRQIVETRQISKHVARMLSEQYAESDAKVRTIRAGLASEYRRVYDLPKLRELNDFHHAKDAYLAAVMGEFLSRRYPEMDKGSFYGAYKRYQTLRTSNLQPSFVIAEMAKDVVNTKTGEYLWRAKDVHEIVERTMGYNDVLVTKMLETTDAEFYGQNALKAGSGKIPIKADLDVAKYGGYSGENGAYCVGVQWQDGKKIKRQLLKLPIAVAAKVGDDQQALREYFAGQLGPDSNPQILLPKVCKNQKIVRGGSLQYIASDNEVHSAKQFTLPLTMQRKLALLLTRRSAVPLSEEEKGVLDEFVGIYLEKLERQYPMYASELVKLRAAESAIKELNDADKVETIKKLLILTSQGAGEPDLSKPVGLGLSSRFGRKMSQTLHIDGIDFIHESITGLRCRIVRGKDL